jgi:hypothetical protein
MVNHQYQASFGEVEKTLDLFDSIIAKASQAQQDTDGLPFT